MNSEDEEILARLKFIGRIGTKEKITFDIKNGEKLSSKSLSLHGDTLWSRISRSFSYHDSRIEAFDFIRDTLAKTFEILDRCANSDKQIIRHKTQDIIADLSKAAIGINNQVQTYSDSAGLCAHLDVLNQGIRNKIEQYSAQQSEPSSPISFVCSRDDDSGSGTFGSPQSMKDI